MLVRRITACSSKRSLSKLPQKWHQRPRQMSSSAPGYPIPPPISPSILGGITTELDRLAPRIDIHADQIQILQDPDEFYSTLKEKIKGAKRRIYFSTLYIGKSEHVLITHLRSALQRNPSLKLSILTDALRGARETPSPSCASLLAPLAIEFPSQVEIRMYHTPNLTGLRKRLIPKRINEGWGLQHMKLYGFDDSVILSGANLSNDYFTNRQDRYHLFTSKSVADYFARVHDTMCSVSFLLQPSNPPKSDSYTLTWPATNAAPSPLIDPRAYTTATTALFTLLTTPSPSPLRTATLTHPPNTSIYPLLTLPHSLNTELPTLTTLLSTPFPHGSHYTFTAGYFNPHPLITSSLLACSSPSTSPTSPSNPNSTPSPTIPGTVLTAHPHANGFYNSPGVSGMLPAAYTLLSRRFLRAVASTAPGNIELREWKRGIVNQPGGWTYHAKGLWITLPASAVQPALPGKNRKAEADAEAEVEKEEIAPGPSITTIGSSNYTKRSYSLDAEVGAVIVTRDSGLMQRLRHEEENLLKYSEQVGEQDLRGGERRVGVGVRVALWIVGVVGGAL